MYRLIDLMIDTPTLSFFLSFFLRGSGKLAISLYAHLSKLLCLSMRERESGRMDK